MRHALWLARREPSAPEGLQRHLQQLFAEHAEWSALSVPSAMVAASQLLLAQVLASRSSSREVATALLAADACVTYAFEAAAEEPQSIASLADRAMREIGVLVVRVASTSEVGPPQAGTSRLPSGAAP